MLPAPAAQYHTTRPNPRPRITDKAAGWRPFLAIEPIPWLAHLAPYSLVRTMLGLFSLCFQIAIFKSAVIRTILPAIFLVTWLSGCAIPKARPESSTRDKAFIEYWPPSNDSKKLRLAVKDLIDMKGVVTTAGSEFLAKHASPAKRDAKCLEIARQRGVQFVGKTNLSELAVAVSGMNAYYGTARNPIEKGWRLVPGGSSSGSAVAVANNEADVAFGTDSAGSIRIPAACCGVVGLKTTFGLVPIDGVYPVAPNELDTVGPMAKDIART